MTTDSEPYETNLPVRFDRKFRPWQYDVSHSYLRLKSLASPADPTSIEIRFHGVVAVKLKSVYEPLTLADATPSQRDEILTFADLGAQHYRRVRCLILSAHDGESFIACLRFSAWSYTTENGSGTTGSTPQEPQLIVRG